MRNWLFILLISVVLFSCATTENYEKNLNSWLGVNIDNLVNQWGYPTHSFEAPNGNKVYVYEYSSTGRLPTYTTIQEYNYGYYTQYRATTYGGQVITYWCRTFFEVDKSNIIIRWRWEGNNCRAY